MVRLSEAMGRLVLSGRELTRMAGFTTRVTDLIEVLDDLNAGKYQRTMIEASKEEDLDDSASSNHIASAASLNMHPNDGKIVYQEKIIHFENVPLVTPNGDVLVRSMNFTVKSGMNVVVVGPNGCGKSSCFRILGELWPLFGGTVNI